MKFIPSLLLLPLWTASAWISGTVVDLSGKPVQGAVVASSSESDVSKPSGGWILGRTTGLRRSTTESPDRSSSLSYRNGHLVLAWNGRSANGRSLSGTSTRFAVPAPRIAGTSSGDTLQVYYHGRRLVWLPLTTSDTEGVEIQIDTAWSDDHGIPWNARVRYGSLRDQRDGKVYRTVHIGSLDWMAENLNYSGPVPYGGRIPGWLADALQYSGPLDRGHDYDAIGTCQGRSDSICSIYGRIYSWYEAVGDTNPYPARSFLPVRGACPEGWRVPNDSDWIALALSTGADTAGHGYMPASSPLLPIALPDGRRVVLDSFGYRPLAGGHGSFRYESMLEQGGRTLFAPQSPLPDSITFLRGLGSLASFWSANFPQITGPGRNDAGYQVELEIDSYTRESPSMMRWGLNRLSSLRCVKPR